jgi:hypothetical protein
MKTILRLTVGAILAASAIFCQPKDVQGWDKVKWGMSVAEVRTTYGSRVSEPIGLKQRLLASLRARGYAEDSVAIQAAEQMPESAPDSKLVIKDIHIGDIITASANVYTASNSNSVAQVTIVVGDDDSTMTYREYTFKTLKPLLIQKYGTPKSEERRPDGAGGFMNTVLLWVFPSTSVKLVWSEDTNPGNNIGHVEIEYKAIDKKAVDAL